MQRRAQIKDRKGMDLTEAEDTKRWQEYTEELYKKKIFMTQIPRWCDHPPRARHPGMKSQVGFKKQHYKQS